MEKISRNLQKQQTQNHRMRRAIFVFEAVLILSLLIVWFSSKSIQTSKSLTVLFFYSFPSEFMVGLLPHEPVLLYYGRYFSPLIVAVVAVISTVMAEALNYSFFGFIHGTRIFERVKKKKATVKIVTLFNKAPFTAILVAGFTPLPFFPVRFLVVMGNYPVMKYLLGVFLSRAPRFYILAQVGNMFDIPGIALVILFAVLIFATHFSVFQNFLKKDRSVVEQGNDL